jgi:hypothetical protein
LISHLHLHALLRDADVYTLVDHFVSKNCSVPLVHLML